MNNDMKTATGTIEVLTYEPSTHDSSSDGPQLNTLVITERFEGDIVGDGKVRFLQALRGDGSASFCGLERVVGRIHGREGSFVLQDEGTLVDGVAAGRWFVIAGSGAGELRGLRGEGSFRAKVGEAAQYSLSYWFET